MTAFTFGEATALVLGRLAPKKPGGTHRTGAPVLRGSVEAGTFEHAFFATPAKGETDRLLAVARAALDAGRKATRTARIEGRALTGAEAIAASLTAGAVRVLEELLTLARLNKGRVYPSYDRLAAVTGLGRATVARGLAILERAGFLVRQRRFARVEGEGAGPRYAQTSNAYRPLLPRRLLDLLPRRFRPAPLPDDQRQREADRAEEVRAMYAGLSARDLARVSVGGPLGRVLVRLGAAIDSCERESHDDPQPLPDFIFQQKKAPASTADTWPDGDKIVKTNKRYRTGKNGNAGFAVTCSLKGASGCRSIPCWRHPRDDHWKGTGWTRQPVDM